jgi:hypothetical protein
MPIEFMINLDKLKVDENKECKQTDTAHANTVIQATNLDEED